jgi:hypothetical protein
MKKALISLTILAMLGMSSCLVTSLHPFYHSEDMIYDSSMEGLWVDEDSCIWEIEKDMVSDEFMGPEYPSSSYNITYYEDEDVKSYFIGTLFQLKGINYADFYPDSDEDQHNSDFAGMHYFPTHTLARIDFSKDSIMLYWYGEEWLTDLFDQNRIRIKHETVEIAPDVPRHILTASTNELQKFITKYANNPKTGIDVDEIFAQGSANADKDWGDTGAFLKLKPYDGPLPEKKAIQVEAQ